MRYMPSTPYSLRLAPSTIRRLAEESGRLGVPARTLAQDLVEEGLRMRRHAIVRFVERAGGRRTVVAHRPRLSVAAVVETVQDSADLPEAAASLGLSLTEIERVLDYYAEFRDEVDDEIARRMEIADREERLFRERERLLARSR